MVLTCIEMFQQRFGQVRGQRGVPGTARYSHSYGERYWQSHLSQVCQSRGLGAETRLCVSVRPG